jgi:hypothetical protein
MSLTFWRFFYKGRGTFVINQQFPPGIVEEASMVVASICELTRQQPETFSGGVPFIGDANMTVSNVAPNSGGSVSARVKIDWPAELDFQVVYFIETSPKLKPRPGPLPR